LKDIQIGDLDAVSPHAWAIRGVIGGISIIWGPTGNYKTFLAIGMSVCVAAGTPWFGCRVREGPVLYILGEGGIDLFRRRAGMAAEYFGVPLAGLPLWVRAEAIDMSQPFRLKPHEDAWDAISPVLVVIDTLSRCLPGDENKQETMQGFVACMDALRDRYGATVLALHHAGKEGTVRGSSVLPGAVDVSMYVQKVKEGRDNILTIHPDKLRDLDTDSFVNTRLHAVSMDVRNSRGDLLLDEYGDKVTTLVIQSKDDYKELAERARESFTRLYFAKEPVAWVGFKEWMDASEMPAEHFKKAVNEILLQPDRYGIVQPERGQYALTEDFDPKANPLKRAVLHGRNYDTEEIRRRVERENDLKFETKEDPSEEDDE
jgi:hypothetical protein